MWPLFSSINFGAVNSTTKVTDKVKGKGNLTTFSNQGHGFLLSVNTLKNCEFNIKGRTHENLPYFMTPASTVRVGVV